MVVLRRHDHEGVRPAEQAGEALERLRRLALRVFLVHAVEERQLQLERVDERRLVPELAELAHDEARGADPLPVGPDGAQDHGHEQGHRGLLSG